MINISLPDGSVRSFDKPVSGADIAAAIGPGLAKAALALRVDGKLVDLAYVVDHDAKIGIVTSRDPEALELLRHDAAHVLAQAVQELYPGTQITFGPATEDGFYYDFVREQPFSPEDFAKIEQRMAEIVDRDLPITREVWDRARIKDHFLKHGESFKAQWADELPKDEEISVYKQGDWLDMCLGPHLPSTGKLGKAFKLTKVSGAYWRGDANNAQLQRVYGTVFFSDKDLKAYLHRIEQAEKRDHRRLGPEMGLFHQQEDAAGMVYWHPKGWTLWRTLENYLRRKLEAGGYVEVKTPQLNDRRLWEKSGHWENFRENMYLSENEEGLKEFVDDPARRMFALKPMNCPCHIQIFNQGLRSYRELPLRMAEMGSCHRFEPSGALHGILRVRAFTQDDAHIFCEGSQIEAETIRFCQLLESIYKDLGFPDYFVKFSDRPPTRIGSDAIWDQAEGALQSASKAAGVDLILNPGEGAFYGPKLEFVLQVDFMLPERLGASYVAEDGSRKVPVMLHRAIFGSFERMIGVLIEHYAGRFPLWLAPTQAVVATIVNDADSYANEVAKALRAAGMRVDLDLRNEKINYKVREHSLAHVPLILAVGRRDMEGHTVAVRRLGSEKQEVLELGAAVSKLSQEARPPF
jgi:threonyl-tRNA synthetase